MKRNTQTKTNEIFKLRHEVAALKSFVIGIAGRDTEGEYKPAFVRRLLKASAEKSTVSLENQDQFLKLISRAE